MNRDPLYKEIEQGLDDLSDGNLFEICMCDLLRTNVNPSIICEEGGDDGGFDGVGVDQSGRKIQVISTIRKDVIGNVTSNLKQSNQFDKIKRSIIVVTSTKLTPRRKRNIAKRIKELGHISIGLYDRSACVSFIYSSPRWRKKLLGIEGKRPALSTFSANHRSRLDVGTIGREESISWLHGIQTDSLLIGQPGSGKTHLLYELVRVGQGYFLVSDDFNHLADSIRSLKPKMIMVDDAHSEIDIIRRLVQLRHDVDAEFIILAAVWEGFEKDAVRALGGDNVSKHYLEPLTPKEILEVIKAAGVYGPDWLLEEIISQSLGKPGLAVTIAKNVVLLGKANEVFTSSHLLFETRKVLEQFKWEKGNEILPYFALGGRCGMSIEVVASVVGETPIRLREAASSLGAAGILDIRANNCVAVVPARLGQLLIRDLLFHQTNLRASREELKPLIENVPSHHELCFNLCICKRLGGAVPDEMIRGEFIGKLFPNGERHAHYKYALQRYGDALRAYARTDSSACLWIFDNIPGSVSVLGTDGLSMAPEDYIPQIFETESVEISPFSNSDLLPTIKDWIQSGDSIGLPNIERRKALLKSTLDLIKRKGSNDTAVVALLYVIDIEYNSTGSPPGDPNMVTFSFGVFPKNTVKEVWTLWPRVLDGLNDLSSQHCKIVNKVLHSWTFPESRFEGISDEYRAWIKDRAKTMISSLLEKFSYFWPLHYSLFLMSSELKLSNRIKYYRLVSALFPYRDLESIKEWRILDKKYLKRSKRLGNLLHKVEPSLVCSRVSEIESIIQIVGYGGRNYVWSCFGEIANKLTPKKLKLWLVEACDTKLSANAVEPLLFAYIKNKFVGWKEVLALTSNSKTLKWLSCIFIARFCSEKDTSHWNVLLSELQNNHELLYGSVLRNEIPDQNLFSLLSSNADAAKESIASGMWQTVDKGKKSESLFSVWREAVVRFVEKSPVLPNIAKKYPDIAYDWFQYRLTRSADGNGQSFEICDGFNLNQICDVLDWDQRISLIRQLTLLNWNRKVVKALVGDSCKAFEELLTIEQLENCRLLPLVIEEEIDSWWGQFALTALKHGFEVKEVFSATESTSYSFSGEWSNFFRSRALIFDEISKSKDPKLRELGLYGINWYEKKAKDSEEKERRSEVYY